MEDEAIITDTDLEQTTVANTKQDKPLLIRLAAETDDPRGARIPGGLESDCAL